MYGEIELARIAVAILGTGLATYYDLTNNRNVPDWLTFGMLGLGAAAVVFSNGVGGALVVAVPAIVVLAAGYLLYRAGQIGGADVLLFAAIALLIPEVPAGMLDARQYVISLPFVFSLFLASGIIFGIVTFAKYLPPAMRALRKGEVKVDAGQKLRLLLMAVVAAAYVWFAVTNGMAAASIVVVLLAVAFSAFFYVFKRFIAENFLIKNVTVKGMDVEDVLAVDGIDPAHVKKYNLRRLLTQKEIERLAKLPIKKFPVYKNMPAFTPYILIALVLTLLFGDLLLLMMSI